MSGQEENAYPLIRLQKSALPFFLCLVFFLAAFMLIFLHFKISPINYLKFLLALLFIVYIPGQSLLWKLKIKLARVESVALSLVLGMTTTTLVYKISGLIHWLPLFFLWLLILLGYFIFNLAKNPPNRKDFEFNVNRTGLLLFVVCLLVTTVLFLDNYPNGIVQEDGSLRVNMHYYDGFLRNAVVRELSHSIPPQMPFAAGMPLSYHYDMDLFVALLYKHFKIGVLDLLHRLTITFYFSLLVLVLTIFARLWLKTDRGALLAIFLILFGSGGFGYGGAILSGYPSYWGKIFYSFYFLDLLSINSFLPSLSVLFAGFFCLHKYFQSGKGSWLVLASFLLAITACYKMTFVVPIIGAYALTALVYLLRHKDPLALRVLLLTVLILAPLLLLAYFLNAGGPQYVPRLRFNNWIIFSLADLKINFLGKPWAELTLHSQYSILNFILAVPILLGFLLGSFGLNALALPRMARDFVASKKENPMRFFLAAFFLTGILYFFVIKPFLGGTDRSWANIYIYFLSVIVLTLFWSEAFITFLEKKRSAFKAIVLFSIIALSVPNMIQFLWAKIHYPQEMVFSKDFLETCQQLNRITNKEAVILHSLNMVFVCYFADRRVVLDTSRNSYLEFHLTPKQIEEREADIKRFFIDPRVNGDVLRKYKVSCVWVRNKRDFILAGRGRQNTIDCFSKVKAAGNTVYQKTHSLTLVFRNAYNSLYKVNEGEGFISRNGN